MKTTTLVMVVLTLGAAPARAERPTLRGAEAPRATDLLRAEKLAEQARKRLETPARRGAKWKHGGSGWNDADGVTSDPRESITINVRPSRRRAPRL
jgi:hypothetical protein